VKAIATVLLSFCSVAADTFHKERWGDNCVTGPQLAIAAGSHRE
jgi:hypothetical protein